MSDFALDAPRLSELEKVVERGLATFVEVGQALMEIRDSRLYRDSHATFEDYCCERWGWTRQHANRTIRAAEVAEFLEPIGSKAALANEGTARELAPLLNDPQTLRDTWAEVVELHPEPTAADVREVVNRRMNVHYSSATDAWSTPQNLFAALDDEFGFTLDVCATTENAKCPTFFTETDDGLAQDWLGVCWMNPPYGDAIARWVKKAYESARDGATVVCLVPARVDTGWWWDYCRHGQVRFLRGRLKFGGSQNAAPFPSAVVVFPASADTIYWERAA